MHPRLSKERGRPRGRAYFMFRKCKQTSTRRGQMAGTWRNLEALARHRVEDTGRLEVEA